MCTGGIDTEFRILNSFPLLPLLPLSPLPYGNIFSSTNYEEETLRDKGSEKTETVLLGGVSETLFDNFKAVQ